MKKNNFNNLNQDIYTLITKNGLNVYIVPFSKKKNFYAVLGVKYGSKNISFKIDKKNIKTPYGTAHFLEHKIFEQENREDPFKFFSKSGINTNASTSFNNTRYYIWGINNLETNLNYLLDFVMSPYFTDENVTKEKGIIKEEILMYEDDPEWVLDDTMRKNLFYKLPIKEKIAGTIKDIEKITKEDLYNAYNVFYNPSNMVLVIGGNFDIKKIEKLILENKNINSKNKVKYELEHIEEPDDVKEEFGQIYMNITVPKMRYSIKLNKNKFKDFDDIHINMYLGIITSHLFGSTSDFKEKINNLHLTTGFYQEKNNFDNFITLDIVAESDKLDLLIDEIDFAYQNIVIKKDELERIKKVWIASEIRMIDNLELTVDNVYNDFINYGQVIFNRVDIIRNLNIKDLQKVIDNLDISNKSIVFILPKEKN